MPGAVHGYGIGVWFAALPTPKPGPTQAWEACVKVSASITIPLREAGGARRSALGCRQPPKGAATW